MKQHLFTVHGWFCWVIHSMVVAGTLAIVGLIAMQWNTDVQVVVNLPAVQHRAR